jgi:hypothetical protein
MITDIIVIHVQLSNENIKICRPIKIKRIKKIFMKS